MSSGVVQTYSKPDSTRFLASARKLGSSIAGEIGESAMEEIELAFASGLLAGFSDDPFPRTRQNVLMYWQHGYYKSTLLRVFIQTIPANPGVVDISSMTVEGIFGSFDEKRKHIIEPAFTNDIKFVIVSELTSLLGQENAMRQFVNIMNAVLENEKVSRQTLKLGQAEVSETGLTELSSRGVSYNARIGELSYTPKACVFAATRPLDNRYFTYLSKSGHFSRFHVIQHDVTDEEASEHLHRDYKLDQDTLAQLKTVNLKLSKVVVHRVPRHSVALMKPIFDDLEALVKDEIAQRQSLKFTEIVHPRLKGNIIRELVAHAFLRIASERGFEDIAELQYTQENVEYIRNRLAHFLDFELNPIIAEEYTVVSKKETKIALCMKTILALLADGNWHSSTELLTLVRRRLAESNRDVEPATFYAAAKRLEQQGKIVHQYGKYKLAEGGSNWQGNPSMSTETCLLPTS